MEPAFARDIPAIRAYPAIWGVTIAGSSQARSDARAAVREAMEAKRTVRAAQVMEGGGRGVDRVGIGVGVGRCVRACVRACVRVDTVVTHIRFMRNG